MCLVSTKNDHLFILADDGESLHDVYSSIDFVQIFSRLPATSLVGVYNQQEIYHR